MNTKSESILSALDTTGRCAGPLTHNSSLPSKPVAPSGGYVTFAPRVKLVTLSTVRALRGEDGENVATMVDDALNAQHIRFAFNIALKPSGYARDLRFWVTELAAPDLVKKFSIEQAIGEILGTKNLFTRPELEVQWVMSTTQICRLLKAKFLELKGSYITRSSLDAFLLARWAENNPR